MSADTNKMLLNKAGAILARHACSRGELRNRLAKMAEEADVENVLDRLQQLNLLNDMDYAYNFALHRIKQKGWSLAKARDSLLQRQVAPATVELAMKRIQNDVDHEAAIVDYVQRYCAKKGLPSDWNGVRKIILLLRQRGFDDDSISGALKRIVPTALLLRLETGEELDKQHSDP